MFFRSWPAIVCDDTPGQIGFLLRKYADFYGMMQHISKALPCQQLMKKIIQIIFRPIRILRLLLITS